MLAAAVAAVVVILTGCSSDGPRPNIPAPAVTPTDTEENEASLEARATSDHLVVSASSIQVVLDDGTIGDEFDYFEPIEPVAAALTDVFGGEPVITTYEGIPSVDYDWSGVSIGTDGPAHRPNNPEIILHVTAAEVHGIGIETVDGIQVGDSVAVLEVANPSHRWQCDGVEELVITVNPIPVTADDNERTFSVELRSYPSDGPVTQFATPIRNFQQ
ncbi:hypothetical protein [Cryobacterium sp. N19]|uniref:hypothetical protein n=1 Tax=Cryobacterium sp. N19 TaxID=2048288 RepID=UPI000CE34078|nr:hypothetical protein [Cryobacterium sp. N19]